MGKRAPLFLIPVAAVAITLLTVWYSHLPAPVQPTSMARVEQEAKSGGYRLIDLATLARLYRSERNRLLLVDTRQQWEHSAGHIAGSVNFPFEPGWFNSWRKKADLKAFLGPDKDQSIVFY